MSNLNSDRENLHADYNKVPVFYCRNCLSLNIRHVANIENSEYCDKCGSTNVKQCSITEWEELYKNRFGHRYLEEY